jgi:hypothetical protein
MPSLSAVLSAFLLDDYIAGPQRTALGHTRQHVCAPCSFCRNEIEFSTKCTRRRVDFGTDLCLHNALGCSKSALMHALLQLWIMSRARVLPKFEKNCSFLVKPKSSGPVVNLDEQTPKRG